MASEAEQAEALAQGPVLAADTSGLTGTYRILLTGAAQSIQFPSGCNGKWLSLAADTVDDVQWGFSIGASVTIVKNQVAAPGSESNAAGFPLFSKSGTDKIIPQGSKPVFLNFISTSTNGGYLSLYVSERLA